MKKRYLMWLPVLCLVLLHVPVRAQEAVYCFSQKDFQPGIRGILLKEVPEEGILEIQGRVLKAGDALTADQVRQMVFRRERGGKGSLSYLPVFAHRVAPRETTVFSL